MKRSELKQIIREELKNQLLNESTLSYDNNMKEILTKALQYYKTGSSKFANHHDHTDKEIDFILNRIK